MVKKSTWRLLEDGPMNGKLNMAIDKAILTACDEGKAPPTLRLYGWDQPTLSIGYSQDMTRDVNMDQCKEKNISIVRRFTGGRALLHQHELTYSLIAPIPHPKFPDNLTGAFNAVSEAVIISLQKAGVSKPEMEKKDIKVSVMRGRRSPACFSATNHWEIKVNEKKLVGSAQRRMNGAFLQHGSVLLDWDSNLAHRLFLYKSENEKKKVLEFLTSGTLTLKKLLPLQPIWEDIAGNFKDGFQTRFPGNWKSGTLNSFEKEKVWEYLDERG